MTMKSSEIQKLLATVEYRDLIPIHKAIKLVEEVHLSHQKAAKAMV